MKIQKLRISILEHCCFAVLLTLLDFLGLGLSFGIFDGIRLDTFAFGYGMYQALLIYCSLNALKWLISCPKLYIVWLDN